MSLPSPFLAALLELASLKAALNLLDWDQQTYMPSQGAEGRALASASLATVIHEKFTSKNFAKLLKNAKTSTKLSKKEKIILSEVEREYKREKKLPQEFVSELAKTTSQAHQVWAEAREKS